MTPSKLVTLSGNPCYSCYICYSWENKQPKAACLLDLGITVLAVCRLLHFATVATLALKLANVSRSLASCLTLRNGAIACSTANISNFSKISRIPGCNYRAHTGCRRCCCCYSWGGNASSVASVASVATESGEKTGLETRTRRASCSKCSNCSNCSSSKLNICRIWFFAFGGGL